MNIILPCCFIVHSWDHCLVSGFNVYALVRVHACGVVTYSCYEGMEDVDLLCKSWIGFIVFSKLWDIVSWHFKCLFYCPIPTFWCFFGFNLVEVFSLWNLFLLHFPFANAHIKIIVMSKYFLQFEFLLHMKPWASNHLSQNLQKREFCALVRTFFLWNLKHPQLWFECSCSSFLIFLNLFPLKLVKFVYSL